MIALWKRFEKERGRQGLSIQQAWDDLVKLGKKASGNVRMSVLATFVLGDETRQWTQKLISTVQEIKRTRSVGMRSVKRYLGELEQQHGVEEANDMIAKGKFRKTKDRWDDECYVKVEEWAEDVREESSSAAVSRLGVDQMRC